ncbi:MAG: 30S ribosomal protein S2 [Clostridia bacterium]|nr:30S ribosomal protein S2 [Clostridia bacterium]
MSIISMKQLLEAGVHFGHQTRKWNPKMKKYIFTDRNKVHIINLEDTSKQIDKAYYFVKDAVNAGAKVLFVGTKKQVKDAVMEEATRCGMFYVNSRWLGGTLTNFKTIRSRVERMIKLENMEKSGEFDLLPKKEVVVLKNELAKLQTYLNGIRDMTSLPNLIIMVDPNEEHICVNEARILNIPTVGLVDTNADPDDVTVCIPANDDAIRSVKLILGALADAIIEAKDGVTLHTLEDSEEKMTMDSVVNESATSNEENK